MQQLPDPAPTHGNDFYTTLLRMHVSSSQPSHGASVSFHRRVPCPSFAANVRISTYVHCHEAPPSVCRYLMCILAERRAGPLPYSLYSRCRAPRDRGLTLIEVCLALVILSIVGVAA